MTSRVLRTFRPVDLPFVLLLALLSTVIGYRFASGNQLEQLPIVLKMVDPSYLPNDPFVAASAEFGPRYYFAKLVAVLCLVMPLPWAYAALQLVADVALATVTMWAASRVIGADRLGAMIATVLTLTVSAIHLGDAAELRYEVFQPASLSIPGVLLAIAMGLLGRPGAAAVAAAIASLPHPLLGVYGGVFGLTTACLALVAARRSQGLWPAIRGGLLRTVPAAAILGTAMLAFWWGPSQAVRPDQLSTSELFAILGYFRAPHHYLPSHFRPLDYVTLALFVWAGWIAFERWGATASIERQRLMLLLVAIVFAGCLAGMLFTEIWPWRAVLALQLFRLLGVLKWVGFLLIGWLLAEYWRDRGALSRTAVVLSLGSAGGAFPVVTAAAASLVSRPALLPRSVPAFAWLAGLLLCAIAMAFMVEGRIERVRVVAAISLLAAFARPAGRIRLAAAVVVIVVAAGIAANRPSGPGPLTSPFVPTFSFSDLYDLEAETARAAGRLTPEDAVFVAPPEFGILRLIGPRALVVDFEAVPFQGHQMRAWRRRVRDVYGDVDGGGHAARAALNERFRAVTDEHLQALGRRYGATHAVLNAETPTSLPVIYYNERYRIVRLAG